MAGWAVFLYDPYLCSTDIDLVGPSMGGLLVGSCGVALVGGLLGLMVFGSLAVGLGGAWWSCPGGGVLVVSLVVVPVVVVVGVDEYCSGLYFHIIL